jgi:hypothetical protein
MHSLYSQQTILQHINYKGSVSTLQNGKELALVLQAYCNLRKLACVGGQQLTENGHESD